MFCSGGVADTGDGESKKEAYYCREEWSYIRLPDMLRARHSLWHHAVQDCILVFRGGEASMKDSSLIFSIPLA